jgi:exodeoxyribonuclease VII small subunit
MVELVPGQELSFEEALTLLEAVVARLEEGQLPLGEAVESYERGMGLAAYCSDLLDSAELRVRQIDDAANDQPGSEDAGDAAATEDEYDMTEEINRLLFADEGDE